MGLLEYQIPLTSADSNGVILGNSYLRSAYLVYDIENNEVAIAPAVFDATSTSTSTSNIVTILSGTGFLGVSSTATLILADNAAAATAPPAGAALAVATANNPPSPTFNLGSAATAAATASSTGGPQSSGAGGTFVSASWAMGLALGFASLLVACIL